MKKNKKILISSLFFLAFKGWTMEGEFGLGEHQEDTTIQDQEQQQEAQRLRESTRTEPSGTHLKGQKGNVHSVAGQAEDSTLATLPIIEKAPIVQPDNFGNQFSKVDDAAIERVAQGSDGTLPGDLSARQPVENSAQNSAAVQVVDALDNPRIDAALEKGLWQRFLDWLQSFFGSSTKSSSTSADSGDSVPTPTAVREAFEEKWKSASPQELDQRFTVVNDLLFYIVKIKAEIANSKNPKSIRIKREQVKREQELTVVEQDLLIERDVLDRYINLEK